MSVWNGWQADLLGAAQLPNTTVNRHFLTSWHENATTDCKLNPIDLFHAEPGSTNCAPLGVFDRHAQAYTNRSWARTAFGTQITGGNFRALLAALETGNPYTVPNPADVETNLGDWGSGDFGRVYFAAVQAGYGGVPNPGPGNDAQTLGGWHDLQHSLNVNLPRSLRAAQHSRRQALRSVSRASKVPL